MPCAFVGVLADASQLLDDAGLVPCDNLDRQVDDAMPERQGRRVLGCVGLAHPGIEMVRTIDLDQQKRAVGQGGADVESA